MATNEVIATCDPTATASCATGTFCLGVEECPDQTALRRRLGVPEDAAGYCWLPQREGQPCTGNIRDSDAGCLPCESGTWCRGTERGPRCVRSCSEPSDPEQIRSDLCGCSSEEEAPCKHWEDAGLSADEFPVEGGEPQFYCDPPRVPNGSHCDGELGLDCADPQSECLEGLDPLTGLPDQFCCHDVGDECSEESDCCLGYTSCRDGTCQPCGREGEPPNEGGCCFGFTAIGEECRSCTTDAQARDQHESGLARCDGSFITLHGTDGDETLALPRDGSTGASPADIPLTSNQMEAVTYDAPEHQIFLLEGDLSGSTATNRVEGPPPYADDDGDGIPNWSDPSGGAVSRYVHLPTSGPGGSTVDLTLLDPPFATWTSVRAYHSGVCSRFVPWPDLLDEITRNLNQTLVDPEWDLAGVPHGSDPLTLNAANITVRLESGTGPLGRSTTSDMVTLLVEYQAVDGWAFGVCYDARIHLHIQCRVRRRAATVPSWDTEILDDGLAGTHACDPELVTELYGAHPGVATIDECSENCYPGSNVYTCLVNFQGDGVNLHYVKNRYRGVRTLTNAYDFVPEIVSISGGLVDCIHDDLNWILRNNLQGIIESRFDRLLAQAVARAATDLPSAALGIAYEDMAPCGRVHPGTGETIPSDYLCSLGSTVYGNHRTRCLGFDDDRNRTDNPALVHEYRCARLNAELRRVNVRPDGVEVVLADSMSDPQYPMISTLLPATCAADRAGIIKPASLGGMPEEGVFGTVTTRIAKDRLCNPDDPASDDDGDGLPDGCVGICADAGLLCSNVAARLFLGYDNPAAQDRCFIGRNAASDPVAACCRPFELCPVPVTSGGYTFSDGMSYRCVSDFSTDEGACGACGNVCAAGERCCGGACIDPTADPAHCGECGNACGGTETCTGGICSPGG